MKKIYLFLFISLIIVGVASWFLLNKKQPVPVEKPQTVVIKSTKESIVEEFSKKYQRQSGSIIVSVTEDTGTFAKGMVSFEGEMGGGLWFAAKTKAGWELAFDGNGIVGCDVVEKYKFPKEMIGGCVQGDQFIER